MKKSLIGGLFWLFLAIFSFAAEWKYQGELELAKDEVYKISLKQKEQFKDLFFRWTLFKNEGLVVHLKYDGFVHQFVLYRDYQRSGFKIPLFSPESKAMGEPYFWLVFKDYRRDVKRARLKFYIHDGGKDFSMISQEKVGSVGFRAY